MESVIRNVVCPLSNTQRQVPLFWLEPQMNELKGPALNKTTSMDSLSSTKNKE